MGGHKIKVLGNPTSPLDAVTKRYVDRRKPLITVWAERKHTAKRTYEWSFGGNASVSNKGTGYTMLAPGRVLRMGLTAIQRGNNPSESYAVTIVVNGVEHNSYSVFTTTGRAATVTFDTPLELLEGYIVNFKSNPSPLGDTQALVSEVVTLLIELDL